MNAQDILLLDAEINFLVSLRRAARKAGSTSLESATTNKLKAVLPIKVREYQQASEAAIRDIRKESAIKAAQYCGRTI